MIQKLRRKFILYAMLSVFALLALILGSINIVNFALVGSDADRITEALAERGGSFQNPWTPGPGNTIPDPEDSGFPSLPEGVPEPTNWPGPMGPGWQETPDSTRFFTFRFDKEGSAQEIAYEISAVSREEAKEWAASIQKANASGSVGWSRTYYRFRVYEKEGWTYVTVMDVSRELTPSYHVLWASLIGSGVGLVLSFLLLLPISKRLVKPVEESVRKQKRFIADASHELKTPLTVISANNEIIEIQNGESEETKTIAKQVGRLSDMVRNLNSLAKLQEMEEEAVRMGSFDLSLAANEIVSSYQKAFLSKNKKLEAEIAPDLTYTGDEASIRQLLDIILDNARKYALSKANIRVLGSVNRILIEVENDAEGLEDGPLDRVFERFYRSEAVRASGVDGSGIGLSMAKEIVMKHHGRISAKAESGQFKLKVEL
ncbi:MAG: HAMP domain-containing histidine kinase [Bacilli bacterium]|nr:HAMP domain-containing histidine kinase [Bacilli bacterium]